MLGNRWRARQISVTKSSNRVYDGPGCIGGAAQLNRDVSGKGWLTGLHHGTTVKEFPLLRRLPSPGDHHRNVPTQSAIILEKMSETDPKVSDVLMEG